MYRVCVFSVVIFDILSEMLASASNSGKWYSGCDRMYPKSVRFEYFSRVDGFELALELESALEGKLIARCGFLVEAGKKWFDS